MTVELGKWRTRRDSALGLYLRRLRAIDFPVNETPLKVGARFTATINLEINRLVSLSAFQTGPHRHEDHRRGY
jgi:hypothetical protein